MKNPGWVQVPPPQEQRQREQLQEQERGEGPQREPNPEPQLGLELWEQQEWEQRMREPQEPGLVKVRESKQTQGLVRESRLRLPHALYQRKRQGDWQPRGQVFLAHQQPEAAPKEVRHR